MRVGLVRGMRKNDTGRSALACPLLGMAVGSGMVVEVGPNARFSLSRRTSQEALIFVRGEPGWGLPVTVEEL